VLQNLRDSDPPLHIAIKHQPDEIYALFAHDIRNAQIVIHNLVDAIEGILLVDNGIEQDTEGPDVLFLAAVGLSSQDFRSCVICVYVRERT
jgi:hypothetical protein